MQINKTMRLDNGSAYNTAMQQKKHKKEVIIDAKR